MWAPIDVSVFVYEVYPLGVSMNEESEKSRVQGVTREKYLEKLQGELSEVREQLNGLQNGLSMEDLQGFAKKMPIKMGYLVSGGFAVELVLVAVLYVWTVYIDPPVDKIEILLRLIALALGAALLGYASKALFTKYRKREAIDRLQERGDRLQEQIEAVQKELAEDSSQQSKTRDEIDL